jgi:hypothetical protein
MPGCVGPHLPQVLKHGGIIVWQADLARERVKLIVVTSSHRPRFLRRLQAARRWFGSRIDNAGNPGRPSLHLPRTAGTAVAESQSRSGHIA